MEFAELKTTFLKSAVMNGYSDIKEIPPEVKEGIPSRLIEKWIGKMNTVTPITEIPKNPRLVNRFTVGADPEYTMVDMAGGLVPAMKLGLNTGLAFGMDMNGRLVELRPQPSRFILDIVASMVAELKWMGVICPHSLDYRWVSAPWDGQDGVGGHVHLARKRNSKDRAMDIAVMDTLYSMLLRTGVFNKQLNEFRVGKTKYGHNSDFRLQKHGYEYRSFPTWMDSPLHAYLVLVLSKLAVYDPDLVTKVYAAGMKLKSYEKLIINLLSYYKNVDDDAWIAYNAVKKWGMPVQDGKNDFKAEWGVFPILQGKPLVGYYPPIIGATEVEQKAVFEYLINKTPIRPEIPKANWEPVQLPNGYIWNMTFTPTYHKMGVGEIVSDLACHNKLRIEITSNDQRNIIQYTLSNKYDIKKGIDKIIETFPELKLRSQAVPEDVHDTYMKIYLPQPLRQFDTIPVLKKIFTSGLFPMWNVKDVKEGCFEDWVRKNEVKSRVKFIGKELTL